MRRRADPVYYALLRFFGWLKWWCRVEVGGLECVPASEPVLVVANHDSQVDPLALAAALLPLRPPRFLARSSLWDRRIQRVLLDAMGHIPIRRGSADRGALGSAVAALEAGEAVAIFPEGTLSRGAQLRARSGAGRLALACPDAVVVLAAVEGATGLAHFPRRPRVRVTLFRPAGGQPEPGENAAVLSARLLAEVREIVPPVAAGRRPRQRRARAPKPVPAPAAGDSAAGSLPTPERAG